MCYNSILSFTFYACWVDLSFGQHSSVNFRKAVLGFIAQLDVDELPLFFTLLIKPLQIIFVGSDGTSDWYWDSAIISIEKFRALNFLKHFSVDNITALSWKKRYGFLHVIEDILGVFDELRVRPFLDFLMGCVVRILGSCTCNLDIAKGCSSSVENHSGANMTLLEQDSAAQNMFLVIFLSFLNVASGKHVWLGIALRYISPFIYQCFLV